MNKSRVNRTSIENDIPIVLTYIPLIIIAIACIFNTIAFLVFVSHKDMKKHSSMRYLAFISIFDTLCLPFWNLNQFLKPNFNFEIEYLNVYLCRTTIFIQFITIQVSSLLRCLVCVDRYFTIINVRNGVSWFQKLPFRTIKSANWWSMSVIIVICLLNSHLILFAGKHTTKSIINMNITYFDCYKTDFYNIRPMWNRVNFVLDCTLPFIIIIIFDILLINRTFNIKYQSNSFSKSAERGKRRLTISLIIITLMYIFMSLPSSIFFSFFIDYLFKSNGQLYSVLLKSFYFSQHSIIFFECYFTNIKFRKSFYSYLNKLCSITIIHKRPSVLEAQFMPRVNVYRIEPRDRYKS